MKKFPSLFFLLSAFIFLGLYSCEKKEAACPVISSISTFKGSTNNSIIIKGKNFGTVPSTITVKFNGINGNIVAVADTMITVKVPEKVTTGKISIHLNGCTTISDQDFIVLPGKWTRKADLPVLQGRGLGLGFSIGNKGYFFAGAGGDGYLKDLYEYDPLSNQWTQKADCGITFDRGVRMVINGKVYLGLGHIIGMATNTNQLWEYNPSNDQWTRKADFPGVVPSSLCGIGLSNKGYVGAGGIKDWWEYDPANNSWTQKADLPATAGNWEWPTAFSMNNKIYAGMGSYSIPGSKELWEYDPAANSWQKKMQYPGAMLSLTDCFTIGSKAYIAGGGGQCWEYDVAANTWKEMAFYGYRGAGATFSIGNKGYYMTGSNGDNNLHLDKDLWEFDPTQ